MKRIVIISGEVTINGAESDEQAIDSAESAVYCALENPGVTLKDVLTFKVLKE